MMGRGQSCWERNGLHAQGTGLTPHGEATHLQTDSCARSSSAQILSKQLVPEAL